MGVAVFGFYFCLLLRTTGGVSIMDYGAQVDDSSTIWSTRNAEALEAAFAKANTMTNIEDRVVVVPSTGTFYILQVTISNVSDVTLQLDGSLKLSNDISAWQKVLPQHTNWGALEFRYCDGITIRGNEKTGIDGQGWQWWVNTVLNDGKTFDNRPFLVRFHASANIELDQVHLSNSPFWTCYFEYVENVWVHNSSVLTDIWSEPQATLLNKHGMINSKGLPMFPLNTDGYDIRGRNVLIEDVEITNFDDAVAVKPVTTGASPFSDCSEDVVVRNARVKFGVGMAVGSVPPHTDVSCVRNVLFENVMFEDALKAIYIKTNPGNSGTGIIENIKYSNIHSKSTIWTPIWIGPQQQKQPGEASQGCSFLYPLDQNCITQPRVSIRNVTLENVMLENSLLWPGVVLCNELVPCTEFTFTNVTNTGKFMLRKNYVYINVVNDVLENNSPQFALKGTI